MALQLEVTTGRPQTSGRDDTALLEAPHSTGSRSGSGSRAALRLPRGGVVPLPERSRASTCIDTRDLRGVETRRTIEHRLLAIAVACSMVGYDSTRLTTAVRLLLLLLLLCCKRALPGNAAMRRDFFLPSDRMIMIGRISVLRSIIGRYLGL